MALNVPSSVRVAQGAPEQQLEPPVPQQVAPAHVEIGRQIEALGGVGVVGVGGDEAHAVLQFIYDIKCDIVGDIIYDIVSMKSCAYLRILSPEPMPRQIKGIAPSLGPPIEELAFPLNAPEGAQVAARTRDQVVVENRVELTHRPTVRMMLRRNPQSCPIVIPDPFSHHEAPCT